MRNVKTASSGENIYFGVSMPEATIIEIEASQRQIMLFRADFCSSNVSHKKPELMQLSMRAVQSIATRLPSSVTRLLDCLFNIWPFLSIKFAQQQKLFVKVGSTFLQLLKALMTKYF